MPSDPRIVQPEQPKQPEQPNEPEPDMTYATLQSERYRWFVSEDDE